MPSANSYYIASIRKDYQLAALDEQSVGDDPVAFFQKWFAEALEAKVQEINAMTLATCDAQNKPHARIVLLKGIDSGFVFFTNYQSEKGKQLQENAAAALVFFWPELERQVRIEGITQKVSQEESDQYFNSRPEGSRIGAWSSPQSQIIADRRLLEENYKQIQAQYSDGAIPRPQHWGGYRLVPERIEFWQGRSNRMHDRIVFSKTSGNWEKLRLAP